MADTDQRIPRAPEEWAKEIRDKLDGTLRRFIEIDDDALRELVEKDRARIDEVRESMARELGPDERRLASPEDREALRRVLRMRRSGLLPGRIPGILVPGPIKPAKARAVVRFAGNRGDLEALGLDVRARAQDVFTVAGTRAQLHALALEPACRRLRAPRVMRQTVENASTQAEIVDVQAPRPLNPTGYRGAGTAVGIIDSPLDVTHHGFRDPTGAHGSRVLYYWVQSPHVLDASGNPVAPAAAPPGQTPEQWSTADPTHRPDFTGLNYGRLYTQADIDTAIGLAGGPYGTGANQICCEPTDTEEHGTHCAGIAAGSGHVTNWATAPVHIGAAPEAAIIFVCKQWLWTAELDLDATFEDSVIDGMDFCLRAAAFENLPIAVSTSLATNWGPHNGTTDFDQARDNLLNSFDLRSIVTASGNDDNDDGYRAGTVGGGATETFTLTASLTNSLGMAIIYPIWLDIWYDGPELDYRISFSGNSSGWRTVGQDYNGTLSGVDFEIERDIETAQGLRGIRLYGEYPTTGDVITIDLRNLHGSDAANYHAWVGIQGPSGTLSGSSQGRLTLADTACGKSVLTVGATRKVHPANPATAELITDYSGAGPTADDRIKPEIVAGGGTWGDGIMSAASDQNSGYAAKNGTSMATPLTAGAVALLYEAYGGLNYHLNHDTVKALLTQHANRQNLKIDPADPAYSEDDRNHYGYGRLRMIGPIDAVLPPVDVDLWLRTANDDYGHEPYPGGCFCGAPDIRVCNAGTDDEITRLTWGTTYDVKVRVRNLGDSDAIGATLRLKYTLPHAAPDDWFEAEDASDNKLSRTVDVPAMDDAEFVFSWRPEASEIGAPAADTHFCLLAEVDHPADPLVFAAPSTGGGNAWATNIKGTNNVALQNLHIQ
jgi:subtilisin family serine protease